MNEKEIQSIMKNFMQIANLSGIDISKDNLTSEIMGCPHEPPTDLPKGRVAVYVFCHNKKCLKVGKAGPKSKPRFTYQHYNPGGASSTLADSLLKYQSNIGLDALTKKNVGNWIKTNTYRFNLFLNAKKNRFTWNLLEAYVQARLKPVFEGAGGPACPP